MKPKLKASLTRPLRLRFRVYAGNYIALGPGKAELLRLVRDTGSISEAARRMKMSYMRAWSLIQTMNRCFCQPVICTARGGQERGGASLTETGEKLLALFERLEADCLVATENTRKEIECLLRKSR